MLGPLPTLHRFVLVLGALVVCVGIGFWLGAMPEIPVNLRAGVLAGVGAGVAAAFVLVHDFHQGLHQGHARPARVRRRTR
ncbi:conserved exported hypothetical protein [metagenome]|uniref:Uncharacterized protein n=1 Tax=metagenome TaxID=256318 RepID=A0A2P2CDI8_9ZZZZ